MAHRRRRDAGRMEEAEGTALPWLNPFVPDNYFQCCYRWPSYIFCDRLGEPTSVAWLAVPAGRRIHLRLRRSEVPPRVNETGSSDVNISINYKCLGSEQITNWNGTLLNREHSLKTCHTFFGVSPKLLRSAGKVLKLYYLKTARVNQ